MIIEHGYRIIISKPYRTYRFEYRPSRTKIGPRRIRQQRIKVFSGFKEFLEDGQIIRGGDTLTMNAVTYNQLKDATDA